MKKNFIGLSYEEFVKKDLGKDLNYDVVNIDNIPKIKINIKGNDYFHSAVEICALIIKKLIEYAKNYISLKNEIAKIKKQLLLFQLILTLNK